MLKGLTELTDLSDKFSQVSPYVKGMAVYSGICYALDLFGVSAQMGTAVNFVLGLVSTVFSLYISHSIIMGVKDIEILRTQDLNSDQLYSTWKLLAVFSLITYALFFVPVLSVICILAGFVVGIYYLVVFNRTKKMFYRLNGVKEAL